MLDRDFLKDHEISAIDIKFDKEVHYGKNVHSCMTLVQDDDITSYHAIKTDDGTEQAVCELKWRKI